MLWQILSLFNIIKKILKQGKYKIREKREKMKDKGKLLRNLAVFLLIIIITFYILLKDQDILQILDIISSVKIQYVIIGIICMFLYITCEAINIGRTLKKLNEKTTFLKNIKYALIGFFFSSVTPAASGGQPMQIYYMHKDNI